MPVAVGLVAQTIPTTNDNTHRTWEIEEFMIRQKFSGEKREKNNRKSAILQCHLKGF